MASQGGQNSEIFKIRNSSLNILKTINFEYKNVFENEVYNILILVQYKKINF